MPARARAPTHGVSGKSAKRPQRSPEPRPLGGFDGRPAGRPPRPAPPCRRTREAARPRQAAVALRLEPLLPRRPPPPASRRRGSSGQPTPPPPPLPPLQPFGRCVTRRFLPTWRPGQVGGDGGQSAAAAGARPHRSQGSPALAGPLIRRLVPRSPRLTAAGLGSLAVSRAEGRVRGKVVVVVVAGKRPPGREKRRSHGRGPLGGRLRPAHPSPAPQPAQLSRPFLIPPLPSTPPPLPHRHPLSFLSALPLLRRRRPPLQPLGSAGRTSRRLLLCVHV